MRLYVCHVFQFSVKCKMAAFSVFVTPPTITFEKHGALRSPHSYRGIDALFDALVSGLVNKEEHATNAAQSRSNLQWAKSKLSFRHGAERRVVQRRGHWPGECLFPIVPRARLGGKTYADVNLGNLRLSQEGRGGGLLRIGAVATADDGRSGGRKGMERKGSEEGNVLPLFSERALAALYHAPTLLSTLVLSRYEARLRTIMSTSVDKRRGGDESESGGDRVHSLPAIVVDQDW